jgi:putative CocE/NonD family hydrolase
MLGHYGHRRGMGAGMTFTVEKDVMVAMRDGVELATDAWIPAVTPAPTLLVRLPYGKDLPQLLAYGLMPNIFALVEAGYAVVYQDCRGTFRSGGDLVPMLNEAADGADTVAWLLRQPWCDGNIGSYGASYLGFVQWASVSAGAPVKAIAPAVTTTDYYTAPWYSEGGAASWHTVQSWTTQMAMVETLRQLGRGSGDPQLLGELAGMMADPQPHLAAMPPSRQPAVEKVWPWWGELLSHPARDAWWQNLSVLDRAEQVTVPALHIGGWFDIFVANTARSFTGLRARAGTAEAREGQRLIIGPWDHLNSTGIYPDRKFGLTADAITQDLTGQHVRFFDRWLRDRRGALDGSAPVKIFVMGIDQWREEQDWPLPGTSYVPYYLHSSGRANTAAGDGELSTEAPAQTAADTFLYDPQRPVPSLGGRVMLPSTANAAGPVDQRPVETRDDVLCFTSAVLTEPLEVTGHVSLTLYASSSAPDTDFTGKLVDVFPDGRAIFLTDGIIRARYRKSLAEPEPLTPGEPYQLSLDLSVTSNVFLPGHRIRLEVSSSNFPRFDRNTNTGGVIADESADQATIAVNRVLHGPDYPSQLILPVVSR